MDRQNYSNHARIVPMYHYVLFGLIVLTLIGSLVNLFQSLGDHQRLYSASLIVAIMFIVTILSFLARVFPLQAQDRAIRAEENLRHYVLTGKLLDAKLTIRQIIALRFAPDDEFLVLARRAAEENLSGKQIKQAIKNWRPDTYRV